MDPVTLIVTALASGAGSGLTDAASSAVTDAYNGLKTLAARALAGRNKGELVLAEHEQAPEVWDKPLAEELRAAGAADNADLLAAAELLLSLIDAAGTAAGKYRVVVHNSQGVQVGDHNTQTLNLGGTAPPGNRTTPSRYTSAPSPSASRPSATP
ncbi:MAG TPA: RIP homotypic interaction motif-containing protein [Streptosporangiaceae bacterium]|jgi:hypothetical protein